MYKTFRQYLAEVHNPKEWVVSRLKMISRMRGGRIPTDADRNEDAYDPDNEGIDIDEMFEYFESPHIMDLQAFQRIEKLMRFNQSFLDEMYQIGLIVSQKMGLSAGDLET